MKKLTALVMRPESDAKSTIAALESIGIETFYEPLSSITTLPEEISKYIKSLEYKFIINSKNSIRSLEYLNFSKEINLIIAGNAAYQLAKSLGFQNIIFAGNLINDLCHFIKKEQSYKSQKFIYACGKNPRFDLNKILNEYDIKIIPCYENIFKTNFSNALVTKIRNKEINLTLFFSPRSTSIFTKLVLQSNLGDFTSNIDCFLMSKECIKHLSKVTYRSIITSDHPNLVSLIEKIYVNYNL